MRAGELKTTGAGFVQALRVNRSVTASAEARVLRWMALRMPGWVNADLLTVLGLTAQIAAGVCYAVARYRPYALLGAAVCLVLNWFGDSMDGTLARVRGHQRPRYGFYVDHMVDVAGTIALLCGLACSGYAHATIAISMLLTFLVLSSESYLATYTLGKFEVSQGLFGPTELRLLLIAGNMAALHSRYATILGRRWLLFDVGGAVGSIAMGILAIVVIARHTTQLYREEPPA